MLGSTANFDKWMADKPLSVDTIQEAIGKIKEVNGNISFREFLLAMEEGLKKSGATTIKIMQQPYIPEGELIIFYNLKSNEGNKN